MSLASDIRDTIANMRPLHATMDSFERGGRKRAEDIEKISELLIRIEGALVEQDDDDDDDFDYDNSETARAIVERYRRDGGTAG
jgi:hypothetical protein